ncbi:MAG: N-acetylglucosamine-6-phosphate deacetylase [Propionibacteriaceae bacterium]|jgi:N-acetylglucosamine-6-phosphate deacetylase|nr:N-acetylglucosamine-6-phosphate deacetylase [Propionibacteriaceae bacterium]
MITHLFSAPHILFPDRREMSAGWIEVRNGVITAAGYGAPPRAATEEADGFIVPGFIDVHAHGGGGANFGTTLGEAKTVLATHRRHGTTTMIASLVTAAVDDLVDSIHLLAPLVHQGLLAGLHLEGPCLSPERKGAHPLNHLINPSTKVINELIEAGQGTIKMVTIAPERAGAIEAISHLVAQDIVVSIGHTSADYATTKAAIAAGAKGATHLFNAMPDLSHRNPGPVLALWQDPRVWLELIVDGIHVDLALVAHVAATAPRRIVLVTDAMAAAGAADGHYMLGELPVVVRDGVARLAGASTIAGSTLTLDRAIRHLIEAGTPPMLALRAATEHAAAYLGLDDVGSIKAGQRADLVFLDNDFQVRRVMSGGAWVK